MKILFFNTFSAVKGGAETLLLNTSRELMARGHEISLVVAYDDRRAQERMIWPSRINRYYVPELIPPITDRAAHTRYRKSDIFHTGLRYVRDIINLERADVLHIHNFPSIEFLNDLNPAPPMVRTVHSYDTLCENKLKLLPDQSVCSHKLGPACLLQCGFKDAFRAVRMRADNRVMRNCFSKILAVSDYVREVLTQNGFESRQIQVLPNFTSFRPRTASTAEEHVVLFAGRPTAEKGLHDVVRAIARTKSRPTLMVLGADTPRHNSYIRSVVADAKESGVVVEMQPWLGEEDLRRAYERSSILAFGSIWPEPFGLVGIEAMMHAKPVVAFKGAGVSEWLIEGETGFEVPRGNHDAFADRIDYLMSYSQLRRRMGQRSQLVASTRFSADVHVNRLLEIYIEVLNESPAYRSRGRSTVCDAQRGVGLSL